MKKIVGQKSLQDNQKLGRRRFLALSGAMGAMALPGIAANAPRELGLPPRQYGSRSPFERAVRYILPGAHPTNGVSYTPLQDLYGVITPSSLHYEVLRTGVPSINPKNHELVIHGLVDQPLVLTMDEIKRMPSSPVHCRGTKHMRSLLFCSIATESSAGTSS
jgi:sulfane dehydrogenase subunit SoxC